jgi:hypothetical protein
LTRLADSQTLRLDETMDSIGDEDPFTAKLSFEVSPKASPPQPPTLQGSWDHNL